MSVGELVSIVSAVGFALQQLLQIVDPIVYDHQCSERKIQEGPSR